MFDIFHRNRQLQLLTLLLVVVWGLSALLTLPRLEDPLITQRNALVITALPGATPERVESLVTEPLEDALLELEEVDHLDSTSSTGTSVIAVTLKESIRQVAPVWGKVRSKIMLPVGVSGKEIEAAALADPKVREYTDGKPPKKVIVVQGKLVNVVV